jgi:hypothetical protein
MNLRLINTFLLIAVSDLFIVSSRALGSENADLPPSWKAGGKAKKDFFYRRNPPQKTPVVDEAEFEPEPSPTLKPRRHAVSLWASLPEFARLEYRYSLSPKLAFFLGASGPMPINVNVSMPSDVITTDRAKTLAVAYPAFDITFKIAWGPHIMSGLAWHPLGGRWYTTWAAGVRSITIVGNAASPLRVCSIKEARKEPPCGNDSAAIQTRNTIALETKASILSFAGRFATGWVFSIAPQFAIMAELGVFAPLSTKESIDVEASILSPDGTPEEVSGALSDLREKSQKDLATKASSELGKVINKMLPVAGIGMAYRF